MLRVIDKNYSVFFEKKFFEHEQGNFAKLFYLDK